MSGPFSISREDALRDAKEDIARAREANATLVQALREDFETGQTMEPEVIVATLIGFGFQLEPNEVALMWSVSLLAQAQQS